VSSTRRIGGEAAAVLDHGAGCPDQRAHSRGRCAFAPLLRDLTTCPAICRLSIVLDGSSHLVLQVMQSSLSAQSVVRLSEIGMLPPEISTAAPGCQRRTGQKVPD